MKKLFFINTGKLFFVLFDHKRDHYAIIAQETSVPVDLFLEAVSLLVEHSSYFTYKHEIYRQTKGLTMGNKLSKILAEIVTNFFTMNAIEHIGDGCISFINKYVDDFVGAMDVEKFDMFESEVTGGVRSLKVERTDENDGKITFLDVMMIRNGQFGLLTRWWQKDVSVQQIMNYFSFHPRSMKENVIHEFVRHALAVTSPYLYQTTMKNLRTTLRRSSYPASLIDEVIKSVLYEIGDIHVTSTEGEIVDDEGLDFLNDILMHEDNKDNINNIKDDRFVNFSCNSKSDKNP